MLFRLNLLTPFLYRGLSLSESALVCLAKLLFVAVITAHTLTVQLTLKYSSAAEDYSCDKQQHTDYFYHLLFLLSSAHKHK